MADGLGIMGNGAVPPHAGKCGLHASAWIIPGLGSSFPLRHKAFVKAMRVLSLLLCLAGASGCASWSVGPDFTPPTLDDLPAQWEAADREHAFTGNVPLDDWWESFHDPVLSRLIERARFSSPTVESALLTVAQYRAQYAIAVGEFFPQTQEISATHTTEHPSGRTASAPQPGEGRLPNKIVQLNLGLQATWELDFWGKYRRGAEAAWASLLGAQAAYELALVTLSADIAQQYFTFRMLEQQLAIARRNSVAQQESVRLTGVMFRLGATDARDHQQAIAMQKGTEADIPQLESQLITARNALCVLLGVPPGPVAELAPDWRPEPGDPATAGAGGRASSAGPENIREAAAVALFEKEAGEEAAFTIFVPDEIAIGVPADIVRRRPDVRRAELEAAAQCARIGVAKARLFPSFSISGFLGFQGSDVGAYTLGDTFTHQAFAASIAPSAVLPILNYGRLYNAVRAQDAAFQKSLAAYRQTVLQALGEAENAMSAFLLSRQRLALLRQAAEAAARSTDLVLKQYGAGSTDFTSVVTAQATQYQQESNVASAAGNTALQAVALFRALGGGWRPQPVPLPTATLEAMKTRTDWGTMLRDMEPLSQGGENAEPRGESHAE